MSSMRPTFTMTVTYPEGSTDEDLAAGVGMEVMVTQEYLPRGAVTTALLRVSETILGDAVREQLKTAGGPLAPDLDDEVIEAMVSMNARLAVIDTLMAMPYGVPVPFGFGIG